MISVSHTGPNRVFLRNGNEQLVTLFSRGGFVHDYMIDDAKQIMRICLSLEQKYQLDIKLRGVCGGREWAHIGRVLPN